MCMYVMYVYIHIHTYRYNNNKLFVICSLKTTTRIMIGIVMVTRSTYKRQHQNKHRSKSGTVGAASRERNRISFYGQRTHAPSSPRFKVATEEYEIEYAKDQLDTAKKSLAGNKGTFNLYP